ncbi:putative alkaline/neutral invertase F isoform X2 [Apium graveolens]|uniref:putative alkaline/neutral invertase F isoform X2 n=1 Tax=Apium graveolens TaxID=4045 RepID=UPI003D79DA14
MSTHSVDVTPSEHVEDPESDVTPSEHVEDPKTDVTPSEHVEDLETDVTPSENAEDLETSCIAPKINFDFSKFPERPRKLSKDGDMLRAKSLSEISFSGLGRLSPQMSSRIDRISELHCSDGLPPPLPVNTDLDTASSAEGHETSLMMSEAWEALKQAKLHFHGEAVGTVAATDNFEEKLNYDQVFVRDFVPSALAFLMHKEPDIVKNFLLKTIQLQSSEKKIDFFHLGEGVMPASFKVLHDPFKNADEIKADFGESAIGRVAPIDSGFWWIILLRAYTKSTGDSSLADMPECQKGMRLILSLCLSEGFDTIPTLLCADGCCMIDRRMGVYGYPIEIQALFFMALRCAHVLLKRDGEGMEFVHHIEMRLYALIYHMREYFWLNFKKLNDIYRYKTEEYSRTAVNKFNVIPDSLPEWIFDFMPTCGGYFIGNVGPSKMDFRWFCLGNCVAILASLATPTQSNAIMDLIEARWEELVGEMPLKICYPAIEGHEWKILTGCDPKNTRWSYHNGGSWPVLIWLLTAACIKTKRKHIAEKAVVLIEERLSKDGWPEYYDGKTGQYIGKQARKQQTWSIAGYLVAKMLLEEDSHLGMIALEEDIRMESTINKTTSCSSFFYASGSKIF